MASLGRTMAVLALPAAAVGLLAGLAVRMLAGPAQPPMTPGDVAPAEPPDAATAPDGEPPAPVRRPRRPAARATGEHGTRTPVRLDPKFAARLDDADERVRHEAALELLRMGSDRAESVDALGVRTPEGARLRDRIAGALYDLARVEAGEDYPRQNEETRRLLRLRYFSKVVPDAFLLAERRNYWELAVKSDPQRLADGTLRPGEAAWHQLELARARYEAGDLTAGEWRRVREQSLPDFRAWVRELSSRTDVGKDTLRSVEEALERIEALK